MAAPVRIERQKDGRHAVIDSNGQVLGLHNSVWSASRQLHSYYQPAKDAVTPARADRRPKIAAPKVAAPRIPRPAPMAPTPDKPYAPEGGPG